MSAGDTKGHGVRLDAAQRARNKKSACDWDENGLVRLNNQLSLSRTAYCTIPNIVASVCGNMHHRRFSAWQRY